MDTKKVRKEQPAGIKLEDLDNLQWRLTNLYWIKDKAGETVLFTPNVSQIALLESMWSRNIILKARQLGFSTLIDLLLLDSALFHAGFRAGIVADTEDTAKELMATKIKFAYEHLPVDIQRNINLTVDSVTALEFTNGSCVHVGVTLRAGTYSAVHVSEFGKICVEHPDKAQEIVTGSLETVPKDGAVFIESTARGRQGLFYDWWQRAQGMVQSGAEFTELDYKPHFFAWWKDPAYSLVVARMVVTSRHEAYFAKLKGMGIALTDGQKAWYMAKESQLGEAMLTEYPSFPEEAFQAALKGVYFEDQIRAARESKRITSVPYTDGILVDTWWDLGMDDSMTIWFTQDVGREIHVIDYFECNGQGLEFYRDELDKLSRDRHYRYGKMVAPHDINVRELGTGVSRLESARRLGLSMTVAPKVPSKMDSIQKARSIFALCWFDEARCDVGVRHLENYRKQWNDVKGIYLDAPLHNEDSHGADAWQTFAVAHGFQPASIGSPVRRHALPIVHRVRWGN